MTLISSIISDAFREGNILPLGRAPSDLQSAEALRLLQGLISSAYGDDAGESLSDWPLGNYGRESPAYDLPLTDDRVRRPGVNQRLIVVNEAALTVWLTPQPQDGSRMAIADPLARLADVPVTLNADGRTIEGVETLLLNTDGLFREWFYRADLGGWVRLTQIAIDEEMPFPADFDNFWMTSLAMRINPRYGRSMDEQSAMIYKNERRKFISRYLQSLPLEINDSISWPFMSVQGYDQQRDFSSPRSFNRGTYWDN